MVRCVVLLSIGLYAAGCLAKPAEVPSPAVLPARDAAPDPLTTSDNVEGLVDGASSRDQRSPSFFDYDDFSDGPQARHLKHKHKPHKPVGCRTHGGGCGGGWQQPVEIVHHHEVNHHLIDHHESGHHEVAHPVVIHPEVDHHQGGHGGNSFATASAGSVGGEHGHGSSQANAQSASFSVGPYTASFSSAQAHSGGGGGGGDYGGHGLFDY